MDRKTRSELLKISEEYRSTSEKVQALLHAEPNREAQELLADALCSGTGAAEKTLLAVVIEDEPTAATRRPRKQRDAPEDSETEEI